MNDPGFILLNNVIENDEEMNQHRLHRRQLRDTSDPLSLPETSFRGIYRLSRELALYIINHLSPFLRNQQRHEIAIPNILKIVTALHFYSQGSYQKSIAQDYFATMSRASISRCIHDVNDAFENLYHLIKFPTTEEECRIEKQGFMNMTNGFPGIIGAIDCTHVAIVSPPVEDINNPAIVFLNRKGFYSINVQIICNSNLKILAINARYPGSVHDSAIWTTSSIRRRLIGMNEDGNTNSWLIGDSGYPLEPWLLTPFINQNLTEAQNNFNIAHRSVRNVIERLNGVFKGRFRCLMRHRALHYSPQTAAKIVYSCAVLHNLCVTRGEINMNEIEYQEGNDDNELIDNVNLNINEGRNVRDRLVRMYF